MSVLVEVTRGPVTESRHSGAFAVVDAAGRLVWGAGDVHRAILPRSATKPLQALPLIETGAADAYGFGDVEIAMASASHRGEPRHVEAASAMLARAGLAEPDLECGAHMPSQRRAAAALIREGREPSQLHNNCSGKHAGFLCTACHAGEATRGYIGFDHPAQRRVTAALGEMCGLDLARVPHARDGCGIPVFDVPLIALARGMARLADPSGLPASRASAASRIRKAMAAEPIYVCGEGALVTSVMQAAPDVLVKNGAEGVFAAILPRLGLGVALKIDDGAMRAADLAIVTVLRTLGCFDPSQEAALAGFLHPLVHGVAGFEAGEVRPTRALLERAA